MGISEWISLILSGLALLGTVITYFSHDRKLKKQEELLNKISLLEAQEREENRKKARINGALLYHGKGNNELVITNSGEAEARNVKIHVLDNSDDGCSWLNESMTIRQLTPGNSYKFRFFTVEGASDEMHLQYKWEDDFSIENEYCEYLQRG